MVHETLIDLKETLTVIGYSLLTTVIAERNLSINFHNIQWLHGSLSTAKMNIKI